MKKQTIKSLMIASTLLAGVGLNAYAADRPDSDAGTSSPGTSIQATKDNATPASNEPRNAGKGSGSVGQFVDDATITTRVKTRFAEDPTVSALRIKVDTTKGVVELSGNAGSDAERAQAAAIARGVPDVKSVRNNIAVKAGSASTPASSTR